MIDLDSDLDLLEEYWSGVGARLEQARKAKGFEKRKEVAELLGVTVGRISNFEAGIRRLSYIQLKKFAELYSVSSAWLAGYDKNNPITLAHLNNESTGELGDFAISKEWLKKNNLAESDVSTVVIEDDSMTPLIKPNECILINKSVEVGSEKDLFAIRVHGKVWARWIQKVEDSCFSVTSENEDAFFPDQTYTAEQFNQVEVLGRVDMFFRKR
ncbi:XRE family transcriptional regulator [Spartinivicinus poritis]|uniref:LexA family transcriptional regulator n=1 Tax=Spartinivicinus poritis TaxID=2994640 RepID=A0ABT5UJW8_9GAMM|nr:LexA family transcriptional regulator [Spartinivicinus sp. A2-2]MDE1465329.1 LexA family transcriptional regulator [Spartinivicinus sp. A2-2]